MAGHDHRNVNKAADIMMPLWLPPDVGRRGKKPMNHQETSNMSEAEFQSHLRMFRRFRHLAFWSGLHVFVILLGLYFAAVLDQLFLGVLVILAGLAVMGYGLITTKQSGYDKGVPSADPTHADETR